MQMISTNSAACKEVPDVQFMIEFSVNRALKLSRYLNNEYLIIGEIASTSDDKGYWPSPVQFLCVVDKKLKISAGYKGLHL